MTLSCTTSKPLLFHQTLLMLIQTWETLWRKCRWLFISIRTSAQKVERVMHCLQRVVRCQRYLELYYINKYPITADRLEMIFRCWCHSFLVIPRSTCYWRLLSWYVPLGVCCKCLTLPVCWLSPWWSLCSPIPYLEYLILYLKVCCMESFVGCPVCHAVLCTCYSDQSCICWCS